MLENSPNNSESLKRIPIWKSPYCGELCMALISVTLHHWQSGLRRVPAVKYHARVLSRVLSKLYRAKRGSHIPTLGSRYILHAYPLGMLISVWSC